MPLLYRSLPVADDQLPETGERGLGVRVGIDVIIEDEDGEDSDVHPGRGGMSVAPDHPKHLPPWRRPSEFGGTGRHPVWVIDSEALGPDLAYAPDNPPSERSTHGVIEPMTRMSLIAFQDALAETRGHWMLVQSQADVS
jgi:hypothetical protein